MEHLKDNDSLNQLGECIVDDAILSEPNLESFDVGRYGIDFDVVLIDYQLGSKFTGILVSAWIALQLHVPRLTLTSGVYPGKKEYFNGFILKDEITDNPHGVITRIADNITSFSYIDWMNTQYQYLVDHYQTMLRDKKQKRFNPSDQAELDSLEKILDKFEKLIDDKQELLIKEKEQYLQHQNEYAKKDADYHDKMMDLRKQLNDALRTAGEQDE